MEFRILGPLEVVADGRVLAIPSGQQRALLAFLVVHANQVQSADRIADAVWGEELPASGTKALAFHVSRLRDALAPGRQPGGGTGGLETQAGGYVLRVDPEAIDAVRFERLVRDGHARLSADPEVARDVLAEALRLWRGEPLADVAYAEFAQAEVRRLEELRLGALEDRLEADLALGRHAEAIPELEMLVAASPLRERLRGLLMLALYRAGRQAEALRVAGAGRRLLSEELGIDPSPELVRLEARILAQDPALDAPGAAELAGTSGAPSPGRGRNPYKGLRAFGEADSPDFFGREALIARLVARVGEVARDGRLLVVVGPSGSGKSSVVRAGLVPALRAGAATDAGPWRIATMVPGVAPFRELAAALAGMGAGVPDAVAADAERTGDLGPLLAPAVAGEGGRLLLVIDQLEELFVRVDEATSGRFLDGILAATAVRGGRLVVVATLRADFLHVPLGLPRVGERFRDATELVTPLTRAELERAIVRPAELVGARVDPALVVEIVSDVERTPGVLPLLEYALTELFERSDGRRLGREGYEAIGGAIGALGSRADEAWRSLDAEGREIAKQLLLALVDVGDAGVATARRVERVDLESLAGTGDGARLTAVLDDLGRRGLLTFDRDRVTGEPTVQVAHEALLANWPRLVAWVEDLRVDLATRRRLTEAAHEWEAGGRSRVDVASGARLERFEAWARDTGLRLTEGERAYLAASVAERRRSARRGRLARVVVVGVVAAGFLLATGLGVALVGSSQAEAEQADLNRARQLAIASLGTEGELRLLLALQAADATAERGYVAEEAYDALQWALQDMRAAFPPGDLPVGVRAAPDGPRGVFLLAPEALMRLASDRAGRPLTLDECRAYVRAEGCPPVQAPSDGTALGVRTVTGVVPATSLAVESLVGTRVGLLSELPGDVGPSLAGAQGEAYGIDVTARAADDGGLRAAMASGDLPDVGIVARPSTVGTAAGDGLLVDLAGRVDTSDVAAGAGEYAMGLGQVRSSDDKPEPGQYGAPVAAAVDDLLWYPPAAFAANGYQPPRTPGELDALVQRLRDDGRVPWCFGTLEGSPTETAAEDWFEDLYLAAQGLEGRDRWVRGDTLFESPEVHAVADALGGLLMPDGSVFGGLDSALRTQERFAGLPMVALDSPGCWLFRGSSADAPVMAMGAAAVPYPRASSDARVVLGRVYEVVLLRDRPETRRLARALVGEAWASSLAAWSCGAGIYPLHGVEIPAGCAMAAQAARLREAIAAGTFRVRAADALPGEIGPSFQGDLVAYLSRWATDGVDSYGTGFPEDGMWAELRAAAP